MWLEGNQPAEDWDKYHTTGQRRWCFQMFRATPTDNGQWSSEPDGSQLDLHSQSELQGTVENRSLLVGGVAFDILRCWKDDLLQTSEYSL